MRDDEFSPKDSNSNNDLSIFGFVRIGHENINFFANEKAIDIGKFIAEIIFPAMKYVCFYLPRDSLYTDVMQFINEHN